jgi:hypothetical protein
MRRVVSERSAFGLTGGAAPPVAVLSGAADEVEAIATERPPFADDSAGAAG